MKRCVIALAVLSAVIGLHPELNALLEFNRERVIEGEVWRLLTCHVTHWSGKHLFWDAASLVALGFIVGEMKQAAEFLFFLSLLVSITIFCGTELETYRGLSGYCVALYILIFGRFFAEAAEKGERWQVLASVLAIAVLAGKTAIETILGHGLFVGSESAMYTFAPWSHLAGVLGALIWLGLSWRLPPYPQLISGQLSWDMQKAVFSSIDVEEVRITEISRLKSQKK